MATKDKMSFEEARKAAREGGEREAMAGAEAHRNLARLRKEDQRKTRQAKRKSR